MPRPKYYDETKIKFSYLESDKQSGYIDHMIFSIYIDSSTNKGSIMFGNYDVNGGANKSTSFKIMQTSNANGWLMELSHVLFEEDTIDYDMSLSN